MGEEQKKEEAAPEEKKAEKVVEEKKPEEKTEEKPEATEEAPPPPPPPPPPFVLYVDLHCVGCAKKIEKSLLKIRGVEGVVVDMGQNQVTIKGIVEPQAVCNRIMKKTKRRAKVLSPLPPAEGEPMPQFVISQASESTTVELNVNMHCEACALQLKKKILQMRGVQKADTDLSTGKVTVTGTMDANKLVDYVYRRTKKQAKIVPQPEPEKPPEEKKEGEEKPSEEANKAEEDQVKKEEEKHKEQEKKEGGDEKKENGEEAKKEGGEGEVAGSDNMGTIIDEEEHMKRMMMYQYHYQPIYIVERIPPAPQLFSDENPNACTIS